MSLGIVIKAPEGIVLAAESRVTITVPPQTGGPAVFVSFDNATKLIAFSAPNEYVGSVTYGLAAIGQRTAHSFIPEFESGLPQKRLSVEEFAQRLGQFYLEQWKSTIPPGYNGPQMEFVVAGFNADEPYGRVYMVRIPNQPTPDEHQKGTDNFGVSWGGQMDVVNRLLLGYDPRLVDTASRALNLDPTQQDTLRKALSTLSMPVPINAMPLQDCVDLAILFVRTTISAQALSAGIRGCGGPIDVATITRREGFAFVQRKSITGEYKSTD